MAKVVGFDFDNTLIISEDEKRNIAAEIFKKKYGIKRGVKAAYKKLLGKYNRRQKLRMLVKQFLHRNPKKKEIEELYYAFSEGYRYKLATCPLVHCQGMIKKLRKRARFMFLLSLEEKIDVKAVAEHCGVAKYFDEILGGPKPKMKNFMHIIKKHKAKPEDTIYIGDSRGDVLAAKKLGIKVIAVNRNPKKRNSFRKLGSDITISDLCQLDLRKNITFFS